jgi:NAD(P)H dehydrogenase (quinone)
VLLVTGAAGPLGRRVLELLVEARASQLIAVTRRPEALAALKARGVVVRRADFDDPASLEAAFAGADRVLLTPAGRGEQPGQLFARHRRALEAARAAGADHIVYTSVAGATRAPDGIANEHLATELWIGDTFKDWSVLRVNLRIDDMLADLREAVSSGQLVSACGAGACAYVTREDVACAAASVLAGPRIAAMSLAGAELLRRGGHGGVAIDITGPHAITHAELAQMVSDESGHAVSYVPVYPAEVRSHPGLAHPRVKARLSLEAAIAAGQFDRVSPAVGELIGRPATTVREFLWWNRKLLLPIGEGGLARVAS